MKRLFVGAALAATLIVPAGATAAPAPAAGDRADAARECRAERGSDGATREAFKARYRNLGACVSQRARDEHREGHRAAANAARECASERGDTAESRTAFREKFGTNRGKRNAFGRCVSQTARQNEAEADAADAVERSERKNAARTCDEERGETPESRAAFVAKYGTNRNGRNAFGRCVSQTAAAAETEQPA